MSETQIILIVAAVAVIAFFLWRSLREERSVRRKKPLKVESISKDPLVDASEDSRTEPSFDASADEEEKDAQVPEQQLPSEEAPAAASISRERQDAARREAETNPFASPVGRKEPPVDLGIQWVLDITPYEGKGFGVGAIDALKAELDALSLKLPVELWCKSEGDGLYYPPHLVPGRAVHLVATLVMANRAAKLDAVTASSFHQVLEQTAAHNDVDVRTSCDMKQALASAEQIEAFIRYYDRMIEVVIAPAEGGEVFTNERINAAALGAGFTADSGRWKFCGDASEREPVMTLTLSPHADGTLRLDFDVPLANLARGDLKRFFQTANHLANRLGGVWVDCSRMPIDAAGALILQDDIEARAAQMAESGVRAGSDRARMLFSRSA